MPARPGLDRAAVVRAAAALLDERSGTGNDGAARRDVTLAEIAVRLGVRTPSLYNHIDGQQELRRELALFGLAELRAHLAEAAIGKAGDDALDAIAHAYRAFAKERPGLYRALQRAPAPGDEEHEVASDAVLAVLRIVLEPYGLSPQEQIHTIRALRSLAHGFVSLELAGGFGLPVDLDESYRRLLDLFLLGLHRQTEGRDAPGRVARPSSSRASRPVLRRRGGPRAG